MATDHLAVRSFRRRSRIRPGQRTALRDLWPRYGVPAHGPALDAQALFGRRAPLVLEIGFGFGEATLECALADPARDVLAVDVHAAGAGALLRELHRAEVANVRVLLGDAVPLLRDRVAGETLDELRVWFPDPWPKTRHHKRRLVTPEFVALAADRLRRADGLRRAGTLHLATDWEPYAEAMLAAIRAEPRLTLPPAGYAPDPAGRPTTRFEQRGVERGHRVRDLVAVRR